MNIETDESSSIAGISRRALRFRRVVSALCVGGMLLQMACYASIPVQAPGGGSFRGPVTLNVNERGRLLLGARLGTLLERIDGTITASDPANLQVNIATTFDAKGAKVNWGSTPFTIPREAVESISQKKVAKGPTLLVVGAILVGVASLFFGLHRSSSQTGQNPGDGGNPI